MDTREAVIRMSVDNELGPLLSVIEQVLGRLSNRDMRGGFNEGHLKAIVASLLVPSRVYLVRSEPEAERQYVDLLCIALPEVRVNWNFAFELKYLKQQDAAQLEAKAAKAKTQLEGYLQTEDLQRVEHCGVCDRVRGGGGEVGGEGEVRGIGVLLKTSPFPPARGWTWRPSLRSRVVDGR